MNALHTTSKIEKHTTSKYVRSKGRQLKLNQTRKTVKVRRQKNGKNKMRSEYPINR